MDNNYKLRRDLYEPRSLRRRLQSVHLDESESEEEGEVGGGGVARPLFTRALMNCQDEHGGGRPSKFPVKSERDIFLRKVRSILNKISSMNFMRLRGRWLTLLPTDDQGMAEVLQLMVAKALDDTIYMGIYARLIGFSASKRSEQGPLICSIINKQIHNELKRLTTEKEMSRFNGEPESEAVARRRSVTIHRFIAELYVENVFTARTVVERISDLISYTGDAEEALECTCVLLTFAGAKLSVDRASWLVNIFAKLRAREESEGLPMRLKFMLMDLYEMSEHKWEPHNKWWASSVRIRKDEDRVRGGTERREGGPPESQQQPPQRQQHDEGKGDVYNKVMAAEGKSSEDPPGIRTK